MFVFLTTWQWLNLIQSKVPERVKNLNGAERSSVVLLIPGRIFDALINLCLGVVPILTIKTIETKSKVEIPLRSIFGIAYCPSSDTG